MAERERPHLLRQVVRMAAHHRPEGASAAAELRRARRAVAGVAGALLLVELLGRAIDVRTALRGMRAGLALGELPAHAARQQVGPRLEAEHGIAQIDRA